MKKKQNTIIIFTIIMACMTFGCSNNDQDPFDQTIQGTASVNPPLTHSQISAVDANDNPLDIGNAQTDEKGHFEITLPYSAKKPVILSFTGGKLEHNDFEGEIKTLVETDSQNEVYATTLSTFITLSYEKSGDIDDAKNEAEVMINTLLKDDGIELKNDTTDFLSTSPDAKSDIDSFKLKYANKAFAASLSKQNSDAPLSSADFTNAVEQTVNASEDDLNQLKDVKPEATELVHQILIEDDFGTAIDQLVDQLPEDSILTEELNQFSNGFRLCVLHVNDTHSHIEPTQTSLKINNEKTYLDIGGYARLQTKVNMMREQNPNTLFVHAGDAIQGTLYFSQFEGEVDIKLLNMMQLDAMVVGNHEFDKGPELLANLIDQATFDILGTNVDTSEDQYLNGKLLTIVTKTYGDESIGIIGLVTPETSVISSPGNNISFTSAVDASEKEIEKLKQQNINKVVLLSHQGYEEDLKLAREVDDIDIIVGGHSHDLLGDYSSLGMSSNNLYPTEIDGKSGKVCIVQSWEWAKALGMLDVWFDEDGKVLSCNGDAVLLVGDTFLQKNEADEKIKVSQNKKEEIQQAIKANSKIEIVPEDLMILNALKPYKDDIIALQQTVIATIAEDLWHVREPGSSHEVSGETLTNGSYIAPIVCEGMLWKADQVGMDVDIIIQNAGGVRTDIPKGDLTIANAYELLPFGNTLYILELTGKEIVDSIQDAVTRGSGAFPYVAGARYTIDAGQVVDLEIKNSENQWTKIDEQATYKIGTNSYIASGGDDYEIFANASGYRYDTGFVDVDIFMEYVQEYSPISRPESTGTYGIPTFVSLADPHLMAPSLLVKDGEAFQNHLLEDRKLLKESDAIVKATVDAIIANKQVDFVIVSGDLTKDGERISHEILAGYFAQIENAGKEVFVICGNHDINNPKAVKYDGDNTERVETVTPEEFVQIYANYGYNQAIHRDPNSLSYVAEPAPNIWLFAIDSCQYNENMSKGKSVTAGRISAETMTWLKEKLALAKTHGKQIMGIMHHGLLEHYRGQSQLVGLGDEYVVDNWQTVSKELAENGLPLVFTGHYHAQDITSESWDDNGFQYSLTDVETGSLVTYPNPYRVVKLQPDNVADITSYYITEIDYDTGDLPFDEYADEFLRVGLKALCIQMGQDSFGMTYDQAVGIEPFVTSAFIAHYKGDENPDPSTFQLLTALSSSADLTTKQFIDALFSLWTDLSPQDNNLILDVSVGESQRINAFVQVSHYPVPQGVAEIIKCTPDGKTLIYTDADSAAIGFVDISNPAQPSIAYTINVNQDGKPSEPTSVYVDPDGKYFFVAIRKGDNKENANNGVVGVYDISNINEIDFVTDIEVGEGPDSLALAKTKVGDEVHLQIVVAIEAEESDEAGDATLGGDRPGSIDVIQFNNDDPNNSVVRTIELVNELSNHSDINYPEDPQPEYVAIHPNQTRAAVTLQENNAIAIVDISNPSEPKLQTVFSTGTVDRIDNADIQKDDEINLDQSLTGRREPDTLAYLSSGYIVTANEGDTSLDTFGQGEYSGGRGFTIFDETGNVIFDSLEQMETQALMYGHYPDERSEKRGIEVEGITTARLYHSDYVFPASERGSFISVYRVDNPSNPEFISFLPTGIAPEGILVVSNRGDQKILLVSANEKDGTINIFQATTEHYTPPPKEPTLSSKNGIPWAALSGLTSDDQYLYAVPDNAMGQSRIYRIDMSQVDRGQAIIDHAIYLTDSEDNRISIDPEGIAWDEANNQFVIVSESEVITENEILFVNTDGVVQERVNLPSSLIDQYANPGKFGFEGVDVSSDGQLVYVALQRGFIKDDDFARILLYNTSDETWMSARYPFDFKNTDSSLWMGISEITLLDNDTMLVLERDKGAGIAAQVKRICSVDLSNFNTEDAELTKSLEYDLLENHHYYQEKAEGMTVFNDDIWVVNDNDGANWTRLINVGK